MRAKAECHFAARQTMNACQNSLDSLTRLTDKKSMRLGVMEASSLADAVPVNNNKAGRDVTAIAVLMQAAGPRQPREALLDRYHSHTKHCRAQ